MFSVVIPLYNKELSIRNTIQSVLDQTCQEFEIVVVNDGSTDNSAAVVEATEDGRVRLIHQKNQGVSAARNRGIEEAQYEWVAFLDGDDLWKPNHLEVISHAMTVFPNESIYSTSFSYSNEPLESGDSSNVNVNRIRDYFSEVVTTPLVWTSVAVVSKRCLREIGGFKVFLRYGEDLDLWARIIEAYPLVKSDAITAIYRTDAENRSDRNRNVVYHAAFHFDLNEKGSSGKRSYYRLIINRCLYSLLRSGDFLGFFKLLKKQNKSGFIFYLFWVVWSRLSKKLHHFQS